MGYSLYEEQEPTHPVCAMVGEHFNSIRDHFVNDPALQKKAVAMYAALCPETSLKELQEITFSWFMHHGDRLFDPTPPAHILLLFATAFTEAMGILLKREQDKQGANE